MQCRQFRAGAHGGTGLAVDDRQNALCRECKAEIAFPKAPENLTACYACLRAGRAALTKDTELGMISWKQAFGAPRMVCVRPWASGLRDGSTE